MRQRFLRRGLDRRAPIAAKPIKEDAHLRLKFAQSVVAWFTEHAGGVFERRSGPLPPGLWRLGGDPDLVASFGAAGSPLQPLGPDVLFGRGRTAAYPTLATHPRTVRLPRRVPGSAC